MSTHRNTRHRMFQWAAIALLAASSLLAAAGVLHERHIEVDINSGREARTLTIGPVVLSRDAYDTPLSRLLLEAGWQPPPPEWHRAITQRSRTGARINYRYGGILSSARQIPQALQLLSARIPPADQHRLAIAAAQLMQRGEDFIVECNFDAAQIELISEEGKLLASCPAR